MNNTSPSTQDSILEQRYTKKGIIKFLTFTILGTILFVVKVPNSTDSFFLFFIHQTQALLNPVISYIVLLYLVGSFILASMTTYLHWNFFTNSPHFSKFKMTPVQLATLFIAGFIVFSSLFLDFSIFQFLNLQSNYLIGMCNNIFIFMIIAKLILPLISDYGLSEVLEVYLSPLMKPLLRVPGSAIINILTGAFVSVTVSIVLAIDQFKKGVFTKKETVIIITCMTVPSMPLSLLLIGTVSLDHLWGKFYIYLTIVSLLVSFIVVRLPPLGTKSAQYHTGKKIIETTTQQGKFYLALSKASTKALNTHYSVADNIISILINMTSFIPYIITWGTLAIILINNTNLITYISYPYALYLNLFRVPYSFEMAPTILLNFIDVVMPTVILKDIPSEGAILRMFCITLGQMIYLSPFLLILAVDKLTSLKEMLLILSLRILIIVPIACFLFQFIFPGL